MRRHAPPSVGSGSGPAPVVVGEYTLLAKLGEGGMGVVHLARRPGGDRVALKVLRSHIVGDDEARRRLAREVSSLSRIRSRWVAEILDADPWAPVPYVATRYVPGLSLHDHVHEEGPISGRDLLWFAACLAEGLASVHSVGVLHRDVKPSNVLMEGRTPILIDFGLARVADDPKLTHTGWLLGTPGYLAPEILYGDSATTASDVHSWAATVAFAGTARSPFGRGPSMAIMDRVRRGEFDLTGLEGPLRDVVAASLRPEPVERPTLAAILAWLRPQTTEPAALLGAPPQARREPTRDAFDDALAVAALAHGDLPPTSYDDGAVFDREAYDDAAAPTLVEPPTGTLVLPVQPDTRRDPAPDAATRVEPTYPPAPMPVPRAVPAYPPGYASGPAPGYPPPHTPSYEQDPWPYEPETPQVGLAERLRRGTLVLAGSVAVGAACVLAPWIATTVIVVAVWLLRSGSLAASGVEARRQLRGRKWYDGVQLLVHAPWHLVQSIPTTVLLVLWSSGLAVAGGLVCYAVTAPLTVSLFLSGVLLALSLWWGPGGSRVRSPLNRLVVPASRVGGPWLVGVVVLLALSVAAGLYVEAQGISWLPAGGQPFG